MDTELLRGDPGWVLGARSGVHADCDGDAIPTRARAAGRTADSAAADRRRARLLRYLDAAGRENATARDGVGGSCDSVERVDSGFQQGAPELGPFRSSGQFVSGGG